MLSPKNAMYISVVLLMVLLPMVNAEAEVASLIAGKALAQQVYDRENGRDASVRGTMILIEKGRSPRERKLFSYRLDKKKGQVWSLMRFASPEDIAGVGLLTLDQPGDVTDQWLYLPELDKSRRIASDRKGGRFAGSDLYYEDMQDREPEMDWHDLKGKAEHQGNVCELMESVPVKADNSVYSKRVSCIHRHSLIPLWIEFYRSGRSQPSKRMSVNRFDKVQGYWTVLDSTMSDLESGHSTQMRIDKIVFDRNLPDSLFARQALEDQNVEKRFRP